MPPWPPVEGPPWPALGPPDPGPPSPPVAVPPAPPVARESAVAAVPDLAGLYETIGLPVNLQGLAINDLTGIRHMTGDGARLTVSGALVNLRDDDQLVPGLVVELRDSAHRSIRAIQIAPPVARLAGLDSAAFQVVIDDLPKNAIGVAVRFSARGQVRVPVTGPVAAIKPPQV